MEVPRALSCHKTCGEGLLDIARVPTDVEAKQIGIRLVVDMQAICEHLSRTITEDIISKTTCLMGPQACKGASPITELDIKNKLKLIPPLNNSKQVPLLACHAN